MKISYQKYIFSIRAKETIFLPSYKGSTFRGGFGNSFKSVVCVFKNKYCRDCPIMNECSYSYIFETPVPPGLGILNMNKYETIPHPFIIEPPLTKEEIWEKGSIISFNVILIGQATRYLTHFIMAFEYLGEKGLGKGRGKYELVEIRTGDDIIFTDSNRTISLKSDEFIEIPEKFEIDKGTEREVSLTYLTPTRIKYQRNFVTRIEFFMLITNLLRRLNLLHYYHVEARPPEWNHRLLIEEARKVLIRNDTSRWVDWERYSHRQRTRMKLGGVVGNVIYEGRISPFEMVLKAGELFHVGKGTSFGLGMYKVR
ncbi:MAG: CRISPR system precrRNA processing endoribonuclease RAMP protein Cas6 [Candidatus Aminicenantes bacterium]|nr:CRISPR system precrRNA processing endoribonuclease RAMP protein Cas6 [Candidatus Aminicenantes bacterium]